MVTEAAYNSTLCVEEMSEWCNNFVLVPKANSPIVYAVLALDSWNYCSREQAKQPNICKIPQFSLYRWTMYILLKYGAATLK